MADTTLTDGQTWTDPESGATITVSGNGILYHDGTLGGTTKVVQIK